MNSPCRVLTPVGGFFTIDAADAKKVISQINPSYVIPMHYKIKYINLPIASVDEFLKFYPYLKQSQLNVYTEKMPEKMQIILLELI
ncbi:MAG: hypothetical protein STSR0004_21360 [Peptococcaceae bacterium]